MGVKAERVKTEWRAFRHELRRGSTRGPLHDYVDFFVEANRHMPYTKGHVEAVALVVAVVALVVRAVVSG